MSDVVKKYWDARVFGNTFLEEGANKGYIKTGVVQFGVGVSLSPINVVRHTNTNKSGVQEGKNAGMAPLAFRIVEHGVYCMPFFVNPNYAGKTILGQKVYASLADVPDEIDIIDVFRRPSAVPSLAEEARKKGFKVFWMQPGTESPETIVGLDREGYKVVAGRCAKIESGRLL